MTDDTLVPWKCNSCGWEVMVAPDLPVSCSCNSSTGRHLPAVGTILKNSLPMQAVAWIIKNSPESCLCKSIEEKMNKLGPNNCEQRIDELVSDIRESATKAGMLWIYNRMAVKSLIKSAIAKARKEEPHASIQSMP